VPSTRYRPESIRAAKRAVFAHQFDPIWWSLTNDDHRWLRKKLDHEENADGAFGRTCGYARPQRGADQPRQRRPT
jgi:hypothetical protein